MVVLTGPKLDGRERATVNGFRRGTRHRLARLPRVSGPSGSALCFGLGILATIVGSVSSPRVGLALLLAVAVAVGASTTLPGALAGCVQCWGLYSGFLEHRFGELALDAQSVSALTQLVLAGVAASVLGLLVRALAAAAERYTPIAEMAVARPSG